MTRTTLPRPDVLRHVDRVTPRMRRRTKDGVLRAVIYVRISKDRVGAKVTVQRQEKLCRTLAERLAERFGVPVEVVAVYSDNDVSANPRSRKIRRGWREMCEHLATDDVDIVLAYHTDRLYRSVKELTPYIDLCVKRDVQTHCVEAGIIDLATASGRLNAKIGAAIAEYEIDRMGERIQSERAEALSQGKYTGGHRPFGYDRKAETDEDGDVIRSYLVENAYEAELIRDAMAHVIAGGSLGEVCRQWMAAGVRTPSGSTTWEHKAVKKILTRPRNAGHVVHHGEELKGVKAEWPAIVGEDDWTTVCAILTDKGRATYTGSRSLKWIGTNLYHCDGCGGLLRSAGTQGRGRSVYRCKTNAHVTVHADWVDRCVEASACDVLARYGAGLIDRPKRDGTAALHRKLNTLTKRSEALEEWFTSGEEDETMPEDEKLSQEEYRRKRAELRRNIAAVSAQLDAAGTRTALSGVADAPDPVAVYRALPIERRRAVVDALFVVTIRKGRIGRLPAGVAFDRERLEIVPKRDGVEVRELTGAA